MFDSDWTGSSQNPQNRRRFEAEEIGQKQKVEASQPLFEVLHFGPDQVGQCRDGWHRTLCHFEAHPFNFALLCLSAKIGQDFAPEIGPKLEHRKRIRQNVGFSLYYQVRRRQN